VLGFSVLGRRESCQAIWNCRGNESSSMAHHRRRNHTKRRATGPYKDTLLTTPMCRTQAIKAWYKYLASAATVRLRRSNGRASRSLHLVSALLHLQFSASSLDPFHPPCCSLPIIRREFKRPSLCNAILPSRHVIAWCSLPGLYVIA
jgi:hypothetical protein